MVVVQDTMDLDFSQMKPTSGFEPLNESHCRGCLLHTLHTVSEDGLPLGLLDTAIVMRDDATSTTAATRKQRPVEEKESYHWVEGYLKALALARRLPDCEVFAISDREVDIHEACAAWREAGEGPRAEWIIRANQDRALVGMAAGEPHKLFAALEAAPVLGTTSFKVRARTGTKNVKANSLPSGRSARTLNQVIRVLTITPQPPAHAGDKPEAVSCWAVLAEETDPPAGQEPIRWLLVTSKPVTTLADACRIIRLYLRHGDIALFHRVLKTGCKVERIQFTTADATLNVLMVYLVIAWRILYLTHMGRQDPSRCGRDWCE